MKIKSHVKRKRKQEWKKLKYGKVYGGKIHLREVKHKYKCGHYVSDSVFGFKMDEMYEEIPKSILRKHTLCKRCFPDIIVYPDASLPDDLFDL